MEEYNQYQRMKNKIKISAGKLRLNIVLEKLWLYVSVSFIMKLLISRGCDSILVVCNRLLKVSHFITTIEKIIIEDLVRLFRDNVQKLYKLLESVVLDKGLQFAV